MYSDQRFLIVKYFGYIVEAPDIKKMVKSGQKVPEIPFIPSARGTTWKLENQYLVNFESCKSGENALFPWQPIK